MAMSSRWIPIPVVLLGALLACDSSTSGPPTTSGVEIVTDFEGASLESWYESARGRFALRIRRDTNSDLARWYSFRVQGGRGQALTFQIQNASEVSVPEAWPMNRPAVSSDGGQTWGRILGAEYDGQTFTFWHTPQSDDEWIALVPVYNFSRWLALADEIRDHAMVDTLLVLTNTLEGRPVHLVKVTDASVPDAEKKAIWVTARQHPAEVGGSWKAEGLLRWILSTDPQATTLRREGILYMVPFMNPDGVWHGNYRVNTVGANLNREWANQDPSTAPSVAATAARIQEFVASGRDLLFFADLHSYSILRKNFFFYSGADRAPTDQVQEIEALMERFQAINPDFTMSGSSPSSDDTRLARGWVFETFGVQAVTFESAYQDVTYGPFAGEYMSPERYMALGEGFGKAVAEVLFGILD
jgi:murein tripeptide amidase MpaA